MSDNMRKSKEADLLTAYESESDELFSGNTFTLKLYAAVVINSLYTCTYF